MINAGKTLARWVAARIGVFLLLGGVPGAWAGAVRHGVAAGTLIVTQEFGLEANTNANVTLGLSINNFQVDGFNRADYNVRVGVGSASSEDQARGILMSAVAENGRNNFGTNAYPTTAIATNGNGAYRIVAFVGDGGGAGSAIEYNVNVAAAWFPYDRYLGGFARNSTGANGGTNDLFTGSPGLVLGTHFKGVSTGVSVVDLRSFGVDSRTDGILLVTHAKDENNFALSQVNEANGTWNVFIRDNAQPTYANNEQDPVAFVFVPRTNVDLVSGRFDSDGSITMFSGTTPQFTVTNIGTGRWDLRVIGHTPVDGVLIISPEGGGSQNGDNIVSYQVTAAGDAWEIQSRDTPNNGLQTPVDANDQPEPVASFVFIPAPTPGISVTPTNGLVTIPGQAATFNAVLDAPPTNDVAINVASTDETKGTIAPSALIFSVTNWNEPQTVTVTGQEDPAATGNTPYAITLSPAISADTRYQGVDPSDVAVLHMPVKITLLSPTDGAVSTGMSPTLKAEVTNAAPGTLTVRFYGREAAVSGPDFTIVALPDTQMYSAEKNGGKKEMFISQVEWIINNRVSRNIAYVTQLGDIVNDGDIISGGPNLTQWMNATNAMYRQENPIRTQLTHGIPYGVAVGNHEMEPIGDPTGTTIFYNQFFGVPHFNGRGYYGGHYGTNNNNHFDFFNASGLDFIVIYFEFDSSANPAVLAWANAVLQTNANRRAIVVTHNFGNTQTPVTFSAQGAAIYNALKANTNIFMMLAGHVTGQGSRQDTYNGNTIRTFVSDYQGWTNGGNGFMRLITFSPSNNVVVFQTFSPWTGQYLTDETSELWFPYNMQTPGAGPVAGPWAELAAYGGVAPGTTLSQFWPGLQPHKTYEWQVAVTDSASNTVVGPVWRFTTVPVNTPPQLANRSVTVPGDAPASIVFTGTDVNEDPLTYQLDVLPIHGRLVDFNPTDGTVTYLPVRGYRGSDRFTYHANDGAANSLVATMTINMIAPPDGDADGLPDAWEAAYGISDPSADDDGDGKSNLEEYRANTNPTNGASVFQITSVVRHANGHSDLTWSSVGGTRYRLQYSDATLNSGSSTVFSDIVRPLTNEMDLSPYGSASTQAFADDFSLTGGGPTNYSRYYRVKIVQ